MSLHVDVASDGVRVPLARARVGEIARAVLRAEHVRAALVSITFVRRARITALNRRHLHRAGATDVIAFGFTRTRASDPVVGDIYIAPDVARQNAGAHGVPYREELARLVVHGVLHTLGHDHPDSERRVASPMWRRQEELLRRALRPGAAASRRARAAAR